MIKKIKTCFRNKWLKRKYGGSLYSRHNPKKGSSEYYQQRLQQKSMVYVCKDMFMESVFEQIEKDKQKVQELFFAGEEVPENVHFHSSGAALEYEELAPPTTEVVKKGQVIKTAKVVDTLSAVNRTPKPIRRLG